MTTRIISEQVDNQERPLSRNDNAQQALDDSVSVINFEPHNRLDILQAFHELEHSIIDELQRQLNIHRERSRLHIAKRHVFTNWTWR